MHVIRLSMKKEFEDEMKEELQKKYLKNGDIKAIEDLDLRKHLVEEMADVLMYYNDVLLCYGISEGELKEAYTSKFEKNIKRW